MRPASAKAKGRRLQQRVAADLCAAFELHADDVRSCPMGSHGCDVQLSVAAKAQVPWSIECKNQERLNLWAAFAQAEANCAAGTAPVVVAKRNHEEPLCTLRWADALALLRAAKRPRAEPGAESSAESSAKYSAESNAEASAESGEPEDEADVPRLLRRLAGRLEKSAPPQSNALAAPRPPRPPDPPPAGEAP